MSAEDKAVCVCLCVFSKVLKECRNDCNQGAWLKYHCSEKKHWDVVTSTHGSISQLVQRSHTVTEHNNNIEY